DNFIDPESRYPVIATTSRLLATGVDAQTCKLIVLDRVINSMTEFKQIIGRGTRINEDFNKYYFTIMDFKKATENFSDPDFDGEPVRIYEPGPDDSPVPPDDETDDDNKEAARVDGDGNVFVDPELPAGERVKYFVNDVEVTVIAERVQYYGKDGKLITESIRDYTKKTVKKNYSSLDAFLNRWKKADQKQAIIDELEEAGVLFDPLANEVGKDFGPFDLICHVVYGRPPLSRKERAENVKKQDYFTKYGDKARQVLNALLDKFADEGIENIEDMNVLRLQPINEHGTPVEIVKSFGGKDKYLRAIRELEEEIYKVA
ncbi:MAG: restriction endonuclease, partial [Desulfobacterales bacterium]|nr:restriction endonuclease [Desulfobacterales bacterium]